MENEIIKGRKMKSLKYGVGSVIVSLIFVACGQPKLTPEQQKVRTVNDTTNCEFIDTVYFETSIHNMPQYARINTVNKGGNAYKILSADTQKIMGVDVKMTNIEVYRCKF